VLARLQDSLISIIYPQECRVCSGEVERRSDGVACGRCWAATRVLTGSEMLCAKCGAYFREQAAPVAVYCHKCDEHQYDKAIAAGIYEKAIAASIVQLKAAPDLPKRLRSIIEAAVRRTDLAHVDLIMPIPLAKERQIERGFNQAEIIGEVVSDVAGIPLDRLSLARTRHTPIHRIGMDQRARELTVQNAFEVVRPKLLKGRSVLLVDDVLTSGATASYCAKALKKSGASRVDVFTLARAVMR
jgi:ComF family protein